MSYAGGHSRNISTFGYDEMMNVTCHVWWETYRNVFTTPMSSTPHVCTEKMTQATIEPKTKVPLNQTTLVNETVTVRPGKERRTYFSVGIIKVALAVTLTLVVIENVALLVACIIRKRRCCSRPGNPPPPPAVVPLNRWMVGGAGGHAVSTASDGHQYSEIPDDYYKHQTTWSGVQQPYSEIPDEYYTQYYNTRPWVQNPYWVIPDEYYKYENTRPLSYPLTLRVPAGQDEDDAASFYAAAAEVALPPSTRLGGKHPSYSRPPLTRSVSQITLHARQRKTDIRSYGIPVADRYRARDMAAIGRYGRTRGAIVSRAGLYNNPSAQRTLPL
ncbi:Hypp762 [Branchiostoma lanceolatum]|uniref:Hypp762 protein n=1 Tax=Branchiostoma lanceolatum TaxID=7740 RepID=A0A8J9VFX7_BRALA|nr:Hypp762 [Branchiostoma lanceolatum]